jgi:hypothetical protein
MDYDKIKADIDKISKEEGKTPEQMLIEIKALMFDWMDTLEYVDDIAPAYMICKHVVKKYNEVLAR